MKHTLGIVLTVVGVVAGTAFSMQRMEAQSDGPYTMYSSSPMQLRVSTRSGQVLASLEIPAGMEVSISAPSSSITSDSAKNREPVTFTGDVSIRTRLRSELVDGVSSREQMRTAPFRLDVQDAVVVVTRKQ